MPYLKLPVTNDETCIDDKFLNHMQDGISGAYFTTDRTLTLAPGQNQINQLLSVNMATGDNRALPIAAAEVDTIVGNIDILLKTI